MILMSFVLFAVLVLAWLVAPSTGKATAAEAAPVLMMSESPAD